MKILQKQIILLLILKIREELLIPDIFKLTDEIEKYKSKLKQKK